MNLYVLALLSNFPPFLSILNFDGIGLSLVTFFNFYKGPVVLKHDRKILLLKHL